MGTDDDIERVRVRAALRQKLFGVDAPPVKVGRFELRERLGEGASGVVYRAHDPKLSRDVAIKVLRGAASTSVRERLEREGRALAKLSHPNVVAIYDVGEHGGSVFLAMELVPGTDLRRWLAAAPRTDREVLDVIALAGAGLAAAHREGLVHRDLKPENVLVAPSGVRVADFGLAAVSTEADGARVGTPAYMAPEQWAGGDVDARADQYALAMVALEALSRETLADVDAPPSRERVGRALGRVSRGLRPIIARALAPDPAARFASVDALLAALAAWRARASRVGIALTIAAVVTLVGALGLHAVIPVRSPCQGAAGRLYGAWDDAASARVDRAFRATGLAFAPRSAELDLVRAALDAYRDEWIEVRTDVCEATHVRHEQSERLLDDRMRCLDQARDALAATASVLGAADAQSVARATRVVDALPSLSACRTLAPRDGALPEPAMPADRRVLARATAALAAGRIDAAIGDAERSAAAAQAHDAPLLEANARTTLGRAQHEAGRYDAAEGSLFDAITLAIRAGDHAAAARAAVLLASTLCLGLSRYPDAERWARFADAELSNDDGDHGDIETERQLVLMDVHRSVGHVSDATSSARRALGLARHEYTHDSPRLATALTHIGFALGSHEGCALVEEARDIRVRVLGPDHPDLGESYDRLAWCAQSAGDEARAADLYSRALALRVAALGPDHRDVARSSFNFAWLRLSQDRLDDAAQLYTAARRGYALAGNRHFEAAAIAGLGEVRYRERRYAESLALLDEADAIYAETLPHESGSVARTLVQRGNALLASGRAAEAAPRYAEAARICDLTGETGLSGVARLGAGLSALADDRAGDAVALLERAIADLEPLAATQSDPDLAVTRFQLARALLATGGDDARIHELATAARRALADQPHPERTALLLADVDAFLAAPSLTSRRSAPGDVSTFGAYRIRW